MTNRNKLMAAVSLCLAPTGLIPAAAVHAQGNPPVLNGEQRDRQTPLPTEAHPKPPLATKVYAKSAAGSASGYDLVLRQVNVPTADWYALIKSAGANHERIAARIASISPSTDLYWTGYVAGGASVIVNTVVSHPGPASKTGGPAPFVNSGESFTLIPSVDRTGLLTVKLTKAVSTVATPAPGAMPRQDEQRSSYPVSLKNGQASALAQTTPVDDMHVDVVILTATIDNR